MYQTSEFRKGLKIEVDGKPYVIVDFLHVKPGKGGAFIRTKLKNLLTGQVIEPTFRSGEKVGKPDVEEKEMQYLYKEGDHYCFMDNSTYEQVEIPESAVGDAKGFMLENVDVQVLCYNQQPVGVVLPFFVELAVAETEPGVKGDTASGGSKPAKLETGAVIQVPLFINEGDRLKVDTRTGDYIERAK
ncbi:MAG: elongation factor P [Deltaproteobacteria bacterium]|nr:elongation factor P [Deltaproteobacteria bacterium]